MPDVQKGPARLAAGEEAGPTAAARAAALTRLGRSSSRLPRLDDRDGNRDRRLDGRGSADRIPVATTTSMPPRVWRYCPPRGLRRTIAHHGMRALEAARERPNVVLLDIGLPGMDGAGLPPPAERSHDFHRVIAHRLRSDKDKQSR
jgi:hypothetical protein